MRSMLMRPANLKTSPVGSLLNIPVSRTLLYELRFPKVRRNALSSSFSQEKSWEWETPSQRPGPKVFKVDPTIYKSHISPPRARRTATLQGSPSATPAVRRSEVGQFADLDRAHLSSRAAVAGPHEPQLRRVHVATATTQGLRPYQEDRASWHLASAMKPYHLFSVLDGHSGHVCEGTKTAWEYGMYNLPGAVQDCLEEEGVLVRDAFGQKVLGKKRSHVCRALESAYLRLDGYMEEEKVCGGAAAVTALLADNQLYLSHVGDCRAMLCRDGLPAYVTRDHSPLVAAERERVVARGGVVKEDHRGVVRVMVDQGKTWRWGLMMTRCLGDHHMKQYLTAEPEVTCLDLCGDHSYLLLASDGVFENLDDEKVFEALNDSMRLCRAMNFDPQDVVNEMANGLVEVVEQKARRKRAISDNATALIVLFDWV